MPKARQRSGQATAGTADPINQFLTVLAEQGHVATFEGQSAALLFEVLDTSATERWYVTIRDGDVTVSRRNGRADAIVRMKRAEMEAVVTGRLNAQTALLRGLISAEGSVAALLMFQRCLPGPPGSTGRVAPISGMTVTEQRRAS